MNPLPAPLTPPRPQQKLLDVLKSAWCFEHYNTQYYYHLCDSFGNCFRDIHFSLSKPFVINVILTRV